MTAYDTDAIVTHFSGLPADASRNQKILALSGRMTAAKRPVTVKGIEKWFERDGIPAYRLLQLFELPAIKGRTARTLESFRLMPKRAPKKGISPDAQSAR